MFLDIASHAHRGTLIHDWRKNGFSAGDQREIAVGATSPDARTGAVPRALTLMTWTGPVGQDEDAEEKARREVGMAWTVFSHLTELKQPQLPGVMSKTDGERTASRHNSISPGRLLSEHYSRFKLKRPLQDLGIANLESIANDALLAAAARAHLPSSGKLNFRIGAGSGPARTIERASPKPTRMKPSLFARAFRMISSPPSRKRRSSPHGNDLLKPAVR